MVPLMPKSTTIQRLLTPGIIAILRSPTGAKLIDAAKAVLAGGVTALEVTMTTPGALNIIRDTKRALGDQIVMGVGSVLDAESCRSALLAGAEFVVTPAVRPEVIQMANRYGVPIACGALTPTEAIHAHELGADFIKLFPADNLGARYIRSLLAPLPMLQIIPTGGVTPENAVELLNAGAVALGVGSALVSQDILDNGDWPKLTKLAGKFMTALKKVKTA
jgi:2-dehydro-3-deoxyphosphogluconate aldolase/(4S)-4-hydroxy-2-oxoglutarate aldolase